MNKAPCHKAYVNYQRIRALCPLDRGAYKLKEAHSSLEKILRGFDNIVAYRKSKTKAAYGEVDLGGFLARESPTRLRKTPVMLAKLTAYKVLPGLKALTGDGVSIQAMNEQLVCFEKFIEDFIPECDAAYRDLKAPITQEYERLNDGSSELIWLTRKLMSRVNVFLDIYEESS